MSQTAGVTQRITKYFKGVISELKKVNWPNRPQLLTFTGVVLVTVMLVGVIVWLMDSVFSSALSLII